MKITVKTELRAWAPFIAAVATLLIVAMVINPPPGIPAFALIIVAGLLAPVRFPPRELSRGEKITEALRPHPDDFDYIPWLVAAVRFGGETEKKQARNKLVNLLGRVQKSHASILKGGDQARLIKYVFGTGDVDSEFAMALLAALRRIGSPSVLPRLREAGKPVSMIGVGDNALISSLEKTIGILELKARKSEEHKVLLRPAANSSKNVLVRSATKSTESPREETLLRARDYESEILEGAEGKSPFVMLANTSSTPESAPRYRATRANG